KADFRRKLAAPQGARDEEAEEGRAEIWEGGTVPLQRTAGEPRRRGPPGSSTVNSAHKRSGHECPGFDLTLQADAAVALGQQQPGRLGEGGGGRGLDRLQMVAADLAGANDARALDTPDEAVVAAAFDGGVDDHHVVLGEGNGALHLLVEVVRRIDSLRRS